MKSWGLMLGCRKGLENLRGGMRRGIFFGWWVTIFFWGSLGLPAASLGFWPQVSLGQPAKTYITGVAYGNGVWVAVGEKGFMASSTDGIRWTRRSAGMRRDFNGVAFTGVGFVAVAKVTEIGAPEAKIFVSDPTGARWTPRDTDAGGNAIGEGLHGVAADGMGTVVAVGGAFSSRITVSHDYGQSWSAKNLSDFGGPWGKLYGVAYGQGRWLAVGSGCILLSNDGGTSWSKESSDSVESITYGNGRWVRTAMSPINEVSWAPVHHLQWQKSKIGSTTGSTYFRWARGCAFFDGLFVAVGEYGDIWTSETGRIFQEWKGAARQSNGADMICVAGGDRGFMAGGADYVYQKSYGAVWASPPWLKARLGSRWDYPYTVFDAGEVEPQKIGLPDYQVNTSSLNLLLEGTLFFMQTPGPAVNLRLVYNSAPTKDNDDSIGLFGKNWRLFYESLIGQFGPEARLITGGGKSIYFTTPEGQDLDTATPSSPISLQPPEGIFDRLVFYGPGQYFEFEEKATRLTYRYGIAGGPGQSLWRLTRITDRSGNSLTLNVDGESGRISRITDSVGRQVNFSYDMARNLCTSVTVPDGRRISFAYDDEAHKNLEEITDMAGHMATFRYDALGFITQMRVADRTTRFQYARRPGYEDPDSEQDNAGDQILASVTNPAGGITRYETMTTGGVKRTAPGGATTIFGNSAGQTTRVVDPVGKIHALEFSVRKLPAKMKQPGGGINTYEHDSRGNLTKVTDALGYVATYAYDGRDNLIGVTDALGQTTSYTYDGANRLLSVTSPLGWQTTMTYLGNGRVATLRDARQLATTMEYDGYGHLRRVTNPLGHSAQFTNDLVGRVTGCTDPLGRTKTFAYDANDRLVETRSTSATGQPRRTNAFDPFGQTSTTDPMGRITSIERNEFGYPVRITDPLGNSIQTEYDPANNPVRMTDALGRVSVMTFDSANRPLGLTDPAGNSVARTYDAEGNLIEFTDAKKNKTSFAYDATNLLVGTTDALGRKNAILRDAVGRIEKITNARRQEIIHSYDVGGRLTALEHRDENGTSLQTVGFTRDANGNLTGLQDGWGATTLAYDENDQPVSVHYPTGLDIQIAYDAAGQISKITYPNGLVVDYTYDNHNRAPSPTLGRSGRMIAQVEPPSRITSVVVKKGSESKTIGYEYDAAAFPTRTDRPDDVPDTSYTYDTAGRLHSMVHVRGAIPVLEHNYQIDAAGNIVGNEATGEWMPEESLPEPAQLAFDKLNQITRRNNFIYSHDSDGNLIGISQGQLSATYDAENRLTSITRLMNGSPQTTNYTYNASGQRVKREVVGGETVQFHYGPSGELFFTTDGNGQILQCYIWKGSSLAAILEGETLADGLSFSLCNHLGSVLARTGLDGQVFARAGYEPYGNYELPDGGDGPGIFSFVGGLGVQDEGGGLFYMRNRFYSATTGRFLQRDPIGLEGGANLYAYANGNPMAFVDPSGLSGEPWEDDPGMNWRAQEEAEERFEYWEENGGWANRPQYEIDPESYARSQKIQTFVVKSAWNWVPYSDFVNGADNLRQGNVASATWDATKGALGPGGSVIGQIEIIDEALEGPEARAKRAKELEIETDKFKRDAWNAMQPQNWIPADMFRGF